MNSNIGDRGKFVTNKFIKNLVMKGSMNILIRCHYGHIEI